MYEIPANKMDPFGRLKMINTLINILAYERMIRGIKKNRTEQNKVDKYSESEFYQFVIPAVTGYGN